MSRKIKFVVINIWLFFVLGLFLHTSRNPQILNKYSLNYFLVLILIFVMIVPIYKITDFIFSTSIIKIRKKRFELTWKRKLILFVLIMIELFLPIEFFLRYKYRNVESNSYIYNIDNFHPYLQAKLSKSDNIHVNSFGFRNDEISLVKPDKTFRIVLIGGSTVLNREVSYEKNAARLLEKKLRDAYPDKKIEVINAGKDGYNSEHSLIQYLFNIKDFSPDLVIMWQGINDLYLSCTPSDNAYGSFKRDYSHAFGALMRMATNYFKPPPIISIKSVTLDLIMKHIRDNLYSDIVIKSKIKRENLEAESYRTGVDNYLDVDEFPSLQTYRRNLISFIKAVRADNVFLILGNQANLYKDSVTLEEAKKLIFPKLVCKKNGKFYSMHSIKKGIDKFNETTENVAKEYDVPFIDFDKKIPKTLSYFLDSVHYTEKGNESIASILFDYIKSQQLITDYEKQN